MVRGHCTCQMDLVVTKAPGRRASSWMESSYLKMTLSMKRRNGDIVQTRFVIYIDDTKHTVVIGYFSGDH